MENLKRVGTIRLWTEPQLAFLAVLGYTISMCQRNYQLAADSTSGKSFREKAVFLDRDGTIVEDVGYLHELARVKFLPRASLAIKLLNEKGFKVIIITNQAGVARGYFTEETVQEMNSYIRARLAEQAACIDMIYYCPHHIEGVVEEYRRECYSRKPNPGMIEQAVHELGIDLANSFVIGDKTSDVEAGHRAGCLAILLADGASANSVRGNVLPDHTAPDLYEAVQWLLQHS